MDDSKPPVPPSEFRLRSACERIAADIASAKSAERVAVGQQSLSAKIEVGRDDPSHGSSVAVYYRNEEKVREGFLIALRAMGISDVEQYSERLKPSKGGLKP